MDAIGHEDVARLKNEVRRLRAQVQQQFAEMRRLESQVLVERAAKGALEAQLEKYYRHIGWECLGSKVAEQHVENGASDTQSRTNNPSHTSSSDAQFEESRNGGSRQNGEMNGRGTPSAIVTEMPGEKDIKVQIKEESQPFFLVTDPSNDDGHELGTSEQVPFGSHPCNDLPENANSTSAVNSESIIPREEIERVTTPQQDLSQPNTIAHADPQSVQGRLDNITIALQPPDDQPESECVTVCASLQTVATDAVKDNEQQHPTPARSAERATANQTDDISRILAKHTRCITASRLPVAECGATTAIPAMVSSESRPSPASHEANWPANVTRPPNLLSPELLQIMQSRIPDMTPFSFKRSKSSARYVSMRRLQEVCGRVSGRILETEFAEPKLRGYTRIFIADVESSPFIPFIPGAWGLFLRVELDGSTISTATPGEREVLAVRVGPKRYNIMGEYEFNSSHPLNIREIQLLPEKCKESLLDEFRRGILHVGSKEPNNLLSEKPFELGILKVLVWTMKFIRYNWSFKKRLLASKEPKPIAPKNNAILTQYFFSAKPSATLKPCQPVSSESVGASLTDTYATMNVDGANASTSEGHTYRDPSNMVKGRRKRGPPGIRANDAVALQQAFGAEAEQGILEALETTGKRRRRISSDDESYKESDSDWLSSDNDVRADGGRRQRRKVGIISV